MNLTDAKFLNYELNKIPELVINIAGEDSIKSNLKLRIDRISGLINNTEKAKGFMGMINHPNKNINDYNVHLIDLNERRTIVSSISFREKDNKFTPYVNILMKDFDMINSGELQENFNLIYDRYKIFEPVFLRFFEINTNDVIDEFTIDDNFVAGHIKSIQDSPKPERYEEVNLDKITDLTFYEKYAEEYEAVLSENPMFENERIESREDIEYYISNGTIYKVIINEKYAGVYILNKTKMNYLNGYYVIEQFLFKEFRNRNFAAALQRKTIDNIEAEENEFIFGTIHPDNKASLRTAVKCGRFIAGRYFKLNF